MNEIVKELAAKGMKFDQRCDLESASNYLTYNVTWSSLRNSLKQFSSTIDYNKRTDELIYSDIYFYDLIQAGLLDYYYNEMIKNLLSEFEQVFKNYFLEVYNRIDEDEQIKIINFINDMDEKQRFINHSFQVNDIYDIFSFITLAELIDLFNNMLFAHQVLLPYVIPQSFAVFFKDLINNKGLTLFMERDEGLSFEHVENNFQTLTYEQINYLEVNPYNNSCYLAMQLIKLTYLLESRSASLKIRKLYTKEMLINSMDKCNVSLSKSNLFDTWVNSHFELLEKIVKETYLM